MTAYYRDLDDPTALLARERDPVTGRPTPAERSKRDESSQPARRRRLGRRGMAAATGGLAAVVIAGGAALAIRSSNSDSMVAEPATTVADQAAVVASTSPPAGSTPPTATPSSAVASTSAAPTSTAPASSAPPTAVPALTSATLTTGVIDLNAQATPNDPGASATVIGPIPGELVIECTASGCAFPLVANSPGAVTTDGGVMLPAVDGRIAGVTTRVQPCTGSQGGVYSSTISTDHDLTLSDFVEIDGLLVPTRVSGTIEQFRPDAGYVPRVGEVVDPGREVGCAGQTLTYTIDAPLSLDQEAS